MSLTDLRGKLGIIDLYDNVISLIRSNQQAEWIQKLQAYKTSLDRLETLGW